MAYHSPTPSRPLLPPDELSSQLDIYINDIGFKLMYLLVNCDYWGQTSLGISAAAKPAGNCKCC